MGFDSDFEEDDFLLPPMDTFITPSSSNAVGIQNGAVLGRDAAEILALDTEADDDPGMVSLLYDVHYISV